MNNIKIVCGSIVDDKLLAKVEAIVNPTNPYMIYGSGVCGAIFKKAGIKNLEQYCKETFNFNMSVKEIRITPGFNIGCDIIFAQGPKVYDYKDYKLAEFDLLETYKNILNKAIEKGYKAIALPFLGTGIYGFKHELVALPIINLLTNSSFKDLAIILVNINNNVCEFYKNLLGEN